jgi:hypothetical protein
MVAAVTAQSGRRQRRGEERERGDGKDDAVECLDACFAHRADS